MSNGTADKLILAVPSKGRLMEQTTEAFAAAGLTLRKTGNERGYRGEIVGLPEVDVAFVSASEIAWNLKTGRVHLGRHRRGSRQRADVGRGDARARS